MRQTLIWCLLLLASACIKVKDQYQVLAPGIWRGLLELEPPTAKSALDISAEASWSEHEEGVFLPFFFEVIYTDDRSWYVELINGQERIKVDHVSAGRNPFNGRDTVTIYFDLFDSYLTGEVNEGVMAGRWVRNNRLNYQISFVAHYGQLDLFPSALDSAKVNFSGTWETHFEIETDHPYPAVGLFEQQGSDLRGTFMTETGDYRYLSGKASGNEMHLSVFDGAHAFLFKGKYQNDQSLLGTFWSGHQYKTLWKAIKNPDFKLKHPDSLTRLVNPGSFANLTFTNLEGGQVKLTDEPWRNKAKILQIMGTWCPNCLDETKFLIEHLSQHHYTNLEVIALGFESYASKEQNLERLKIYRDKLNIPYTIWYAGNYKKAEASKVLPLLNKVSAFPTLIFLDANNQVKNIHTGFNGPATPKYGEFKQQFEQNVKDLLEAF